MRTIIALLAMASMVLLLPRCGAQKEMAFDYPPNITADSQQVFVQHFKKGHVLYESNCARCHTQDVNGHKVIPDFSLPQLLDYEMRFQYQAHEEPLKETRVSVQELDDIQVFLQYKKPSGVPAFPDRVPKIPASQLQSAP
jgi:mono/diheme cytochrome c family protein